MQILKTAHLIRRGDGAEGMEQANKGEQKWLD